jgi:hypothetical protein
MEIRTISDGLRRDRILDSFTSILGDGRRLEVQGRGWEVQDVDERRGGENRFRELMAERIARRMDEPHTPSPNLNYTVKIRHSVIKVDAKLWDKDSPLTAMGYHVGETSSLDLKTRRNLLTDIYKGKLEFPADFSHNEKKAWSTPGSSTRLKKIATHIKCQIKKFINRPAYDVAVADWSGDLEWLRSVFYETRFKFVWPS